MRSKLTCVVMLIRPVRGNVSRDPQHTKEDTSVPCVDVLAIPNHRNSDDVETGIADNQGASEMVLVTKPCHEHNPLLF